MPEPREDGTTAVDDAPVNAAGATSDDVTTDGTADGEATTQAEAPREPAVPDAELLAAVDLARAALLEITPAETVGDPAGSIVEGDRVLSLLFANTMPGYPGWLWTVTLARVDDAAPTVLEAELMPGDGALLSPEWLPWSDRLAGIEADQEAERLAAESEDDDDDDDDDDEEDEDEDSAEGAEDTDDVLDGVDFEAPASEDDEDDEDEEDEDEDDEDEDEDEDEDDDDDDDTSFDGADR